ncbi:hypothetical protein PG991_001437 [Apiospora marii]|uniref:Uncharacterized protein n=1 Tax=Apiospora marii TaxID=335849 RepID=A0ABR1SS23_9PEZI
MPSESLVLANCKNGNNVLQSQMAYINDTRLDATPMDVAVMKAPAGQQLFDWFCKFSSSQFTTTGVQFNATLGPKREEGDYVGNGTNGYDYNNGGFRCWQESFPNRYYQGQFVCAQVIRCDHRVGPSPLPSTSCSAASGNSSDTKPHELTTGVKIGIGVGSGFGGLTALVAIVFAWRYFRNRSATGLSTGQGEQEQSAPYVQNYYHYHPQELDAAHGRVEADSFSPLGELPVAHQQHELETPESKYYTNYDAAGNTLPRP